MLDFCGIAPPICITFCILLYVIHMFRYLFDMQLMLNKPEVLEVAPIHYRIHFISNNTVLKHLQKYANLYEDGEISRKTKVNLPKPYHQPWQPNSL